MTTDILSIQNYKEKEKRKMNKEIEHLLDEIECLGYSIQQEDENFYF